MARHRSFEEKITIVEYYLRSGRLSQTAQMFDISESTIKRWAAVYLENGPEALRVRTHHQTYTAEFKESIVQEYLTQDTGFESLAIKYNIASHSTLMKWHMAYTERKRLKSTFGGIRTMVKSRKTTYEERLEIARCLRRC